MTREALTAQALDAAVRAVCPITGISIGNETDKATWRIDYDPSATSQQRADAQSVVTTFDLTAEQAVLDSAETRLSNDTAAAKADSAIQTLIALTPAQAKQYINENVTTLAQAKTQMGIMAALLCVLARKAFDGN